MRMSPGGSRRQSMNTDWATHAERSEASCVVTGGVFQIGGRGRAIWQIALHMPSELKYTALFSLVGNGS